MYRLMCDSCGLILSLDNHCSFCGAEGDYVEAVDLTENFDVEPDTD
ncbi:MAG: hypothetical protein [Bacteriophage sp.]|nr:MAG: hypothetical protein [Bacteriophage sp.]